jgi:polar amino acid transport system permease protein
VGFAAVLAAVVLGSPGWPRFRESFLDLDVARASFPRILEGLWLNIRVLVVAEVCILVLALGIALLRTLRGPVWFPLRTLAAGYTDVFRGVPLIIMLYIIGFGLPGLRLQGVPTSAAVLGTIAIVLVYSAYVAEVFRAGIETVHPSQRAAARSLGLTYGQTMRLVVLPQAVRRVVPPLLNDLVALQKDVGLISVLGAVDAVRAAQIESARYADFTPYVVAGLLFVLLAVPTARLADHVTLRAARRQQAGATL